MVRGLAVAGVLVVACQFPHPGDAPSDASPDAAIDAPTDARAELVFGRWDYLHTTAAGVTPRGLDLSSYSIGALIPSGAGYSNIAGVGRSDGTFEIDDVPPGVRYVLRVGRLIAVTDGHEVQLGTRIPTRTAPAAAASTAIDVTLQGLSPLLDADVVTLTSRSADAEALLAGAPGATTIAQRVDAAALLPYYSDHAGLPSSAAGDDLFALQSRVVPGSALTPTLEHIVAAADLSTVVLLDGQTTTVAATLAAPSRTLDLSAGISIPSLAAGASPLTRPRPVKVVCAALPADAVGWSFDGRPVMGRPIVTATSSATSATIVDVSGAFPDPFPTAWPRLCEVDQTRDRWFRIPGASTARAIAGGIHRVVAPTGLGSSVMPPPTAIRIGGIDGELGGVLRSTATSVAVIWTGSSQATQYVVSVYQLRQQAGPRLLAAVLTSDTQVDLPAELLAGGDFVAFVVTALSGRNDYAAGELAMDGVPGASASAVTAMFRWSATCGDGTPDVGEDCDAGSASPTCDADCTAAICGDGIRNVLAGELCDSIVDATGCDDDCTANVCGDGHVNTTTEECDDGGAQSGDGCSAACRTEP